MAKEENIQEMQENSREAKSGRGAPRNESQTPKTAQTTAVNPPEEVIPTGTNPQANKQDVEALKEQEKETGVHTTGGYGINKSGQMNNVAVEPEMYVEEKDK
ncbi:hypothetical protein [Oscillatoria salina]|uniref:hypothetical protein n=1 Tax=Oscillatoria salina TaxID=331517 RepID=UPI0013B87C6D|nr:hypothetical protein [Oscillatoria salina]MBZ8180217.1 hypothetical protein [Oscillatoria salina IIICB1]NET89521.1 hypothetical protein [Kamptonema sp. SIO1D9]